MKIQKTHQMLQFNYAVTVESKSIKADVIFQCWVGKHNSDHKENGWKKGEIFVDIDMIDYENVFFMDMPVEDYKGVTKLKSNLKDMGIDWDKLIDNQAQGKVTKETVLEDNKALVELMFGK